MEEKDESPPVTVDRSLSVENFLLQELQIRSNAITQIRSDNTGIFNIYLVLIGLMLTGVAALQTLKFQIIDAGKPGSTSFFWQRQQYLNIVKNLKQEYSPPG